MKKQIGSRLNCKMDGNTLKLSIILVIVLIVAASIKPDTFFSASNLSSFTEQVLELGLFSVCSMIVIISGGIDLSIIAMANISGIVVALIMKSANDAGITGIALGLLIVGCIVLSMVLGMLMGMLNGFLIAYIGLPAMLATLGTMYLWTGVGTYLTKAQSVMGFPKAFTDVMKFSIGPIPITLIIFILLLFITWIILGKTKFGVDIRFLGTNERASIFSGIQTKSVILKTYMFSGIICGLAGLEFVARANSAKVNFGSTYLFNSILCAIIGGVNPFGGEGRLSGVVLSMAILQLVTFMFNTLRIDSTLKECVFGAVLLIILLLNYITEQVKIKKSLAK